MGVPYLLFKRKQTSAGAQVARPHDIPRLRSSAEVSTDSLGAYSHRLGSPRASRFRPEGELPASYFLQNWRWYIREHWKQALITSLCYLLTFLLWRRLV